MRVFTVAGGETQEERPAYGLADNFLLIRERGKLGAYTHIQYVKSSSDTQRPYGLPSTVHGMDAFRDYSGCLRYVDVLAIDNTVKNLKRDAIHIVLHTKYSSTMVKV